MATVLRRMSCTAIAAVALVALASCSDDSPDGSADASSPAASAPASAPPSPEGPCADGTCEIEVSVGDVVAVPDRYGLGPIEITAINADDVEMVAPLTGSGYSVSGCSGGGGVSSRGGGGVGMRCGLGTPATINDAMRLVVVKISGAVATLRIEPTA